MNGSELILLWLVVQAAATDLTLRRIPNVLVAAGLLLALALRCTADPQWSTALDWLAGAMAGLLVFLPMYVLRGMAAGDVKLMAMVGGFTGAAGALVTAVLTALAGGALALLWLSFVPAHGPERRGMPYGVAIAFGTMAWLFWQHR
ncbi:A24 family peptidase [Massilia endophytica]|uniref:A24 family peptidase n=1 Tax=Massilia endophytica TaxID=2899220 RepID=UPI001E51C806|nr:prepilin peptidase [Massilia endophytica]UGQ46183.1 prepilin peptidase [Massilia endophytica]